MTRGHVYAIAADGSPLVKLGFTRAPVWKRVFAFQVGSPLRLRALWNRPGGRPAEQHLLRIFGDLRAHGEWFDFGVLTDGQIVSRLEYEYHKWAKDAGPLDEYDEPEQPEPFPRVPSAEAVAVVQNLGSRLFNDEATA